MGYLATVVRAASAGSARSTRTRQVSAWARGGLPGTCATSARVLAPARCPNWIWGVGLLQLCRLTSFIAGVRQVAPAVCRARVARNWRSVLVRIAWRYSIGTLHGVRPVALDFGFVPARLHLDRFLPFLSSSTRHWASCTRSGDPRLPRQMLWSSFCSTTTKSSPSLAARRSRCRFHVAL